MELVGKVVRKEIDGVGFCSGTVQSYDDPSGYYKIVYENGVTETSKLAEFAAAALATGGEGKSEETPVHRKRNRDQPGEEKLQDEVNVMRNFDLNEGIPEEESDGLRGNVDLNCGAVETLALDLNRAVPEPEGGLGYEERSSNKRRRQIDLNMDASCDLDGADLNRAVPEPDEGLGYGERSSNKRKRLIDLNMDASFDLDDADLNRAVPEPDEGLGYEESCSNKRRRLIDLNMDAEVCDLDDAEVCDLNADKREGWFDLNVALDVESSKDGEPIQMNVDGQVQETNMQDDLETGGLKEVHVAEVSSGGQHLEEIREQNSVSLQDAPDANGAEGDHDLHKSLSDKEIPDENTSDRMEGRIGSGNQTLNMDASFDLDDAEVCDLNAEKREGWFDLNVAVDVESSKDGELTQMNGDGQVQETNMQDDLGTGGFKEVHVAEVSSGQHLEEIREQNSVSLQDAPDSNGAAGDHDLPEHVDKSLSDKEVPDENTSGWRERRIGSGNQTRIPASSTVSACLADEVLSPSQSVNCLTAEENWIVDGEAENISVLPPKPVLPPSSPILNLEGLPVLYVFATYSFLRSFSTVLFLSPFELKDFVEALRCTSPSLLLDSIHVSVLQILRKGLEKLAHEDDQSATLCLRSLDWDMLDVVNYPLYVVEYLLFSGSKDSPRVDLTRFNFFRNEYFRLPMNLKIEILTCLCGDMIAAEVVRSELNKRSVAVESKMGTNRKTNTKVQRRKRGMMELANDFSSNNGVVDGSSDRNSAGCCICKMDGNLLCCDGCSAAYHSKCVGVACDLLPEGAWYCPECSFDRRGPGWKPEKKIRGSEFIEIDPHGREYYSSCGYLLVIDTDGTGSVNYYHVNDVILVLEQLKSCGSFYIGVTSAIKKHWNIPVNASLSATEKQATSGVKNMLEETPRNGGSHLRCHTTCRKKSGSATGQDILNMSSEGSAETADNGLDVQSLHEPESSSILDVINEPNLMNTMKEVRPNAQSESGYRNQYIFAQMTTAISEEMALARNSPDHTNDMRFDEEIASTQVKTILMKTTKFQWRNIQALYLDAWKEKCGWCHSCKSEHAGSEENCLFNMSLGALRGPSESEIANSQPTDNKSHLMAIIWQLLSMESRLQGLLVGPWLNPRHSKIWRKHILKASSISSLRHLLVELEANLHHLVLSPQWLNHVDSAVEIGSSRHVLIAFTRSSSKTTVGKRRGTLLESGVNPTAKKNGGLTMCWWRGGRLSRQLFNLKVLPRSLVSKAARKGGSVNIPGIMYPENSEPAKRSRRVSWKAAVESSKTSAQLGFQVRTLHSYIKWDDIENSHLLLASDTESKKSARLFKRVIVRSKCIEEETVKYLLDCGKKRSIPQTRYIPDVVLKNGRMIEETSGERIKYWLNESYVPLHLLKGFEERKAVRRTSNPGGSFRHPRIEKVRKRSSERKGFSYLFERADKSESSLCEQCKKDVPLSDAAGCHICKRLFHKKHIRRADEEGMYICLPCRSEVLEDQPIVRKRGSAPVSLRNKIGALTQKLKTAIPARKSHQLKAGRISVRKPLRRSGRKPKQVIRLQDERQVPGGSKKQNLETLAKKARRENSIRDNKRKERCSSYWSNGLRLSRKPGDERISKFWRDGCAKPLENSDSVQVLRKCRLCGSMGSESGSTLIACENCEEWYHGDACGINEENSSMVIGFRCHFCRELSPPQCPHM